MSRPRIILATMVRQEEKIVRRMIDSVLPHIVGICALDTGSGDDTPGIIASYEQKVPVRVLHAPWSDFSTGRNELLTKAIPFAEELGADWLLLLDADHVLHVEPGGLEWLDPHVGVYMMELRGAVTWWMPYLLSVETAKGTRYRSSTHEFQNYESTVNACQEKLLNVWLEHLEDGGNRHLKFDQDEKLLERQYADDPNDARTCFYLAQTIEHKDPARAVELYRCRFDLGGWDEERYVALLRVARLTGAIEDWAKAYEFRPQRWEAAVGLVKALHEGGLAQCAYAVGTHILAQAKEPNEDILFREDDAAEWRFLFEYGLAAFYAGHPWAAKGAWRAVLGTEGVPEHFLTQAESNLAYCP